MILAASLILGSWFGWRHGRTPPAYLRFAVAWTVVLVVQTVLLLAGTDSVRDRDTGELDAAYPLVCLAVFALGLVVVTAAAMVHGRRTA